MEYPWLTESAIEREAAALLHAVFGSPWRESTPVDLEAIVYEHLSERDHLIFKDDADLPPEGGQVVLGKTQPIRGRILLNRLLKDGEPGRARFTLAHELGHWVLHRKLFLAQRETLDLFTGASTENPDFEFVGLNDSTFPRSCRAGVVPREEWQANRFAVALLINPDVLREEFRLRFNTPVVSLTNRESPTRATTLRELSSQVAKRAVGQQRPLRDVFGLSTEAMAIALETRGYVVESAPAL